MERSVNYLYKVAQSSSYQILKIKVSIPVLLKFLLDYLKSTFAQNLNIIPKCGPAIKKDIIKI